jgi:subtilisin
MARITFQLSGGVTPIHVLIFVQGQQPQQVTGGSDWDAPPTLSGYYVTFVTTEGYWDMALPVAAVTSPGRLLLEFPALPSNGPVGWWHQAHRVGVPGVARGAGMRIGIIDEALASQDAKSCIAHVINDGAIAWGGAGQPRAFTPMTEHGETVCALIASRAHTPKGFAGVAPDAQVYFAAAGSDTTERLVVQRIESSIAHLSETRECHIISVSSGDLKDRSPALEAAVDVAAQFGTLCFFAAGNQGTPLYPASYSTCLAVAALGEVGHAPAGSTIALLDNVQNQPLPVGPYYVWMNSAVGPEIEFCAPGMGVIWSRNHCAAAAVFGTSFACPLTAATAALILQNDAPFWSMKANRTRYDYALGLLKAASDPLGRAGSYWKHGLLQL